MNTENITRETLSKMSPDKIAKLLKDAQIKLKDAEMQQFRVISMIKIYAEIVKADGGTVGSEVQEILNRNT